MENVILKNNGFKIVCNIFEMLDGKVIRREDILEDLTAGHDLLQVCIHNVH